jgi:hypothetical protein
MEPTDPNTKHSEKGGTVEADGKQSPNNNDNPESDKVLR